MPKKSPPKLDAPALFAAALLVAVGGLIYELILGTAASYLFGDSIVSFSIATGVTLFGMGIGSLLSAKLIKRAAIHFVWNELALGAIGGFSVLLLFASFSLWQMEWLVFVLLSLAIGIAIGLEIPLLVSLFKNHGRSSTVKLLGKVLALDYFGALVASLLFPFVLLPTLGLTRTAIAVAILNILVAFFILWRLGLPRKSSLVAVIILGVLCVTFAYTTKIEQYIDAKAFRDPITLSTASPYQRIVMTNYKNDTRLYLNNQLQFSTIDEARYHELLVGAAMTTATEHKNIIVLGGGDGIVVRELLKYPSIEQITVVDIDPLMTNLAKNNPVLTNINQGSLNDKRVTINNSDAFVYMADTKNDYDVVIADLVDPSNERLAKLYSKEFYRYINQHLAPNGVFITQASSSYFTPSAFSTIASTAKAAYPMRQIVPLSANVPSFGEWGFIMAKNSSYPNFTQQPLPDNLNYLTEARLRRSTTDVQLSKNAPASTLLHPTVYQRYQADMKQWSYY